MLEDALVYELLLKARAAILRGWTQKVLARDAEGNQVRTQSSGAVCFCTVGALWHVTDDERVVVFVSGILRRILPETRYSTLAKWNDNPLRTQEEVVALYDKALLQYQPKEA